MRASSWLWLLVLAQIALPASYYVRADEDDERFAWRMFSAVRLKRCELEAGVLTERGEREVELSSAVHASWQRTLERGRRAVIERFLEQRCAPHSDPSAIVLTPEEAQGPPPRVTASWLERSCTSPSGERLPRQRFAFDCATRRLERSE